jgi:hypothetical protein
MIFDTASMRSNRRGGMLQFLEDVPIMSPTRRGRGGRGRATARLGTFLDQVLWTVFCRAGQQPNRPLGAPVFQPRIMGFCHGRLLKILGAEGGWMRRTRVMCHLSRWSNMACETNGPTRTTCRPGEETKTGDGVTQENLQTPGPHSTAGYVGK